MLNLQERARVVAAHWLLMLLYVGIEKWNALVNDSRSDVGAYGDN